MSSLPLPIGFQPRVLSTRFTVPGEPIAKGRARSFVRNGHVAHFTPEKTARYENLVRLAAQQAMDGEPPRDGAVRLTVTAVFTIPASWSKKRQAEAVRAPVTKRPDLDNVVKAIKDGCNGVLWRDDCQVACLIATKTFGEIPGVWVCVEDYAQ